MVNHLWRSMDAVWPLQPFKDAWDSTRSEHELWSARKISTAVFFSCQKQPQSLKNASKKWDMVIPLLGASPRRRRSRKRRWRCRSNTAWSDAKRQSNASLQLWRVVVWKRGPGGLGGAGDGGGEWVLGKPTPKNEDDIFLGQANGKWSVSPSWMVWFVGLQVMWQTKWHTLSLKPDS